MSMHHHGMGGQGVFVPALLLGMLMLATAVHVRACLVGEVCCDRRHASGHVLMTVGMGYMLLPREWRLIPDGALALVFGASAAYFIGFAVLARRTGGRGVGWHAELAVADVAMVYMLGPSRLVSTPVTEFLVVYFCIYTAVFGALVLWRQLVIDLPPERQATTQAVPQPPSRVATVSASLSTPSAAAHLAMGAVMVYMLTGLRG
jgi:hypothetical protein